jgi:hypothetical protein
LHIENKLFNKPQFDSFLSVVPERTPFFYAAAAGAETPKKHSLLAFGEQEKSF